jgi:hypothetical protein
MYKIRVLETILNRFRDAKAIICMNKGYPAVLPLPFPAPTADVNEFRRFFFFQFSVFGLLQTQ